MPLVDELPIDGAAPAPSPQTIAFTPFGTPVTAEEVRKRLSRNLYDQLSEKSADTVTNAISRAEIYTGAILKYLQVRFNLDEPVIREIVLMQTVYELHIALGHEEAGREYRIQAKNTIVAAFGSFPDGDTAAPEKPAVAAVAVPPKTKTRF
ncbi:MAG: hypothetical protein LBP27_07085 [Treponema sp.]|jgi:hypothetical protein|nr:hypothetical protein [Treponema sp.]